MRREMSCFTQSGLQGLIKELKTTDQWNSGLGKGIGKFVWKAT